MAIPEGCRFPIECDEAFPQGWVMVGKASPDIAYQSCEGRTMGKPARQRMVSSWLLERAGWAGGRWRR